MPLNPPIAQPRGPGAADVLLPLAGVRLPGVQADEAAFSSEWPTELTEGLDLKNYNITEERRQAIVEAGKKLASNASTNPAILDEEVRQFIVSHPDRAYLFINPETLEIYGATGARLIEKKQEFIKHLHERASSPLLSAEERQQIENSIESAEQAVAQIKERAKKSQLTRLEQVLEAIEIENAEKEEALKPRTTDNSTGYSFGLGLMAFGGYLQDSKDRMQRLESELDLAAAKENLKQATIRQLLEAFKCRFQHCHDRPSLQAIEQMAREAAGIGPLEPDVPFSHGANRCV